MSLDPVALRVHVYDELLVRGAPPTVAAIGEHFHMPPNDIRQALADLKIGKTILVHRETGEIWMAGPFSAGATAYRVRSGDRHWFANCAWDMFGVAMIVDGPVQIETQCTDCGDAMTIACNPTTPPEDEAVVHFLVPARHWYDDIGFT